MTEQALTNEWIWVPNSNYIPLYAERQMQKTEDGIIEIILVLKADPPNVAKGVQVGEFKLNDKYSVLLQYCANGTAKDEFKYVTIFVGFECAHADRVFARVETVLVATNGNRWFRTHMREYSVFRYGTYMPINKVARKKVLLEKPDNFIHDYGLRYEMRIKIDTIRKLEPNPSDKLSTSMYNKIKYRLYDPCFGDTGFIISGVKMYAHRQVMIRNCRLFEHTLRLNDGMRGEFYEFPDTYHKVFERLLVDAYVLEKDGCRECFLYPKPKICNHEL